MGKKSGERGIEKDSEEAKTDGGIEKVKRKI